MTKIQPVVDPKYHAAIRARAKALGLNDLSSRARYKLTKTGFTWKDEIVEGHDAKQCGRVSLIGNDRGICIYITENGDWWSTSIIVNCSSITGIFVLETENSFYQLERI